MAITYEEIDFHQLTDDLSLCCLTQDTCTSCHMTDCIIAYAQKCLTTCLKHRISYVEQDSSAIPASDMKQYEETALAKGIAHTLKICRSCGTDHYDQCIISILRNCYEICLLGEIQFYSGSNFRYLNAIHTINPGIAADIIEEFHLTSFPKEGQL